MPDSKKIHVISFQVPYPVNYGGVIDVYYKLKELKEQGYNVVLHTYAYEGRKDSPELRQVADEIYLYKRNTLWYKQLTLKPYIVSSRDSKELLKNLQYDDAPILFEGLHTCGILDVPELANRKKIVRMHNVESHYYYFLAGTTVSLKKKLYYLIESLRLKRYEKVLKHSNIIMAITERDRDYFAERLPNVEVKHLPCFHNGESETRFNPTLPQKIKYLLYQGNLAVEENINAVYYLAERVIPKHPKTKWIIAGGNPPQEMFDLLKSYENVKIISNPTSIQMERLISHAAVNVLITFQSTGIKLKLLNALYKGGFCVVNKSMIDSTGLSNLCVVVDNETELIEKIEEYSKKQFTIDHYTQRTEALKELYSNSKNITILTSSL